MDRANKMSDQFDQLVTGIRRESAMILDNLGITIEMATLPSWPLRNYLSGQLFGRNRLTWFWCVYIRPWLMPKRQAEIQEAFEIVGNHVRQELLAAVIEKGQSVIEKESNV